MNKAQINIINTVLCRYPVAKAYLFGSYAMGKETANSDIDIMIEFDENTRVNLFQFVAIKQSLENELHHSVDLVSENGVSSRLKPYIEQQKKLIYAK